MQITLNLKRTIALLLALIIILTQTVAAYDGWDRLTDPGWEGNNPIGEDSYGGGGGESGYVGPGTGTTINPYEYFTYDYYIVPPGKSLSVGEPLTITVSSYTKKPITAWNTDWAVRQPDGSYMPQAHYTESVTTGKWKDMFAAEYPEMGEAYRDITIIADRLGVYKVDTYWSVRPNMMNPIIPIDTTPYYTTGAQISMTQPPQNSVTPGSTAYISINVSDPEGLKGSVLINGAEWANAEDWLMYNGEKLYEYSTYYSVYQNGETVTVTATGADGKTVTQTLTKVIKTNELVV